MSCKTICKNLEPKTIIVCCCPKANSYPTVPPWLKKAFLTVLLAVPVVLAARWIVTKGHLEHINERLQYLCKEKNTLECKIQSLMGECCPSQKELSGSTARRKAALDQLRSWAWKSNCTFEKVASLRKEKIKLEQMLTRVCKERDCAKRDFETVMGVIRRNSPDDFCEE